MMVNVGIHGATLCPENMTKHDISAAAVPPAYFARRWPDRKRRAVAECAAGRPVAEVAAHVGVSRATVARWHRQPEFAGGGEALPFRLVAPAPCGSGVDGAGPSRIPAVPARSGDGCFGVSRRTLYRWRCAPDFAAAHDGAWAAYHAQREAEAAGRADVLRWRLSGQLVLPHAEEFECFIKCTISLQYCRQSLF